MPNVDEHGRPEPPIASDESSTLVGFLEYQRATFAWKCDGLDSTDLGATVGVSSMSLGGMLKHLALVEDYWFSQWLYERGPAPPFDVVDLDADPEWDWRSAVEDTPKELWSLWHGAVERSRSSVEEAMADGGLGGVTRRISPDGDAPSLRWIMCHMIEEYARHNGHADLIRESIDGSVGE